LLNVDPVGASRDQGALKGYYSILLCIITSYTNTHGTQLVRIVLNRI